MKRKQQRLLSKVFVCALIVYSLTPAEAQEKLRVVTTLAPFADLVRSVGGEHVDVTSVAAPRFNPHFIEPKPSDVLRVKRADLFVASGLDLEAWMPPLLDAAAKPELRQGGARFLGLNEHVPLLEVPSGALSRSQGDIHIYGNPHIWMSPENGLVMARTIASKLKEIAPAHGDAFDANLKSFETTLQGKISDWRAAIAPFRGKKLVGYHNEWAYLMNFLQLKMEQFLEPKPGIPPTPGQLQFLQKYIPAHEVKAIVQPTFYPDDGAKSLSESTDVPVLYLCQQVGEKPECSDYIKMIDFDIQSIVTVLKQQAE